MRRSARFIENHDESRSVVTFGDRIIPAAVAISTLQGLRFFHDGQFEGRRARLPVQLGTMPDEPTDDRLLAFYRRLLSIVAEPVFHSGAWRPLDVSSAGDETHANVVAWRWKDGGELRIVAVNLAHDSARAHLRLNDDLPEPGDRFTFDDLLNGTSYSRHRAALDAAGGLYVHLERGHAHIFRCAAGG